MKTLILILSLLLASPAFAVCDAKVDHIRDGDSLSIITRTTISPSVHVTENTGFRLLRVYAPEKKHPDYQKAKDQLIALVGDKPVEIRLPVKGSKRDVYGRFLAEIYTCQPDGSKVNVNDQQRANGWTDSGTGAPK